MELAEEAARSQNGDVSAFAAAMPTTEPRPTRTSAARVLRVRVSGSGRRTAAAGHASPAGPGAERRARGAGLDLGPLRPRAPRPARSSGRNVRDPGQLAAVRRTRYRLRLG